MLDPRAPIDLAVRAWAAGFIDGDGCILLSQGSTRDIEGAWRRIRQLRVQLSQVGDSCPEAINLLQSLWGGQVYIAGAGSGRGGKRPYWRWSIAAARAEAFLRDIEPFMVVKREQALLAIAARESALRYDRIAEADEIEAQMRSLKRESDIDVERAGIVKAARRREE